MKKITKKKLTKSRKLENSTWTVLINISWTSWATEMYFTFLESIFYNKQLCKSAKSCKTIFYTWYSPKHQSNFFCTSLYLNFRNAFRTFANQQIAVKSLFIPDIAQNTSPIFLHQSLLPFYHGLLGKICRFVK